MPQGQFSLSDIDQPISAGSGRFRLEDITEAERPVLQLGGVTDPRSVRVGGRPVELLSLPSGRTIPARPLDRRQELADAERRLGYPPGQILTPAAQASLARGAEPLPETTQEPKPTTRRGPLDIAENIGRSVGAGAVRANNLLWGALEATGDILGFESVSAWGRTLRKDAERMATSTRGPQTGAGPKEQAFYSGFESMGLSIPALAAGVASGNPAVTLGIFGGATGGEAYGQARDKGVSTLPALSHAVSQAAIEIATEKIPASRLLKDLAKRTGFAKMLAAQLPTEVVGEQVATLGQDLNDWITLNPDKPFSAYLEARPSAAAHTLIATLTATIGQTAALSAVERVTRARAAEAVPPPPAAPVPPAAAAAPPSSSTAGAPVVQPVAAAGVSPQQGQFSLTDITQPPLIDETGRALGGYAGPERRVVSQGPPAGTSDRRAAIVGRMQDKLASGEALGTEEARAAFEERQRVEGVRQEAETEAQRPGSELTDRQLFRETDRLVGIVQPRWVWQTPRPWTDAEKKRFDELAHENSRRGGGQGQDEASRRLLHPDLYVPTKEQARRIEAEARLTRPEAGRELGGYAGPERRVAQQGPPRGIEERRADVIARITEKVTAGEPLGTEEAHDAFTARQRVEAVRGQTPSAPQTRDEYITRSDYNASLRATYYKDDEKIASSREAPQTAPIPAVGSWMIDEGDKALDGFEIEQLIEVPVENIEISEDTGRSRFDDVERYARWTLEGKEAPPIRIVQTDKGTLKTQDHRRLLAAKAAGQDTIKGWVSWATQSTRNGNPTVGLTLELAQHGQTPLPVQQADPKNTIFIDDAKILTELRGRLGPLPAKRVSPEQAPMTDVMPAVTAAPIETDADVARRITAGEFEAVTPGRHPEPTSAPARARPRSVKLDKAYTINTNGNRFQRVIVTEQDGNTFTYDILAREGRKGALLSNGDIKAEALRRHRTRPGVSLEQAHGEVSTTPATRPIPESRLGERAEAPQPGVQPESRGARRRRRRAERQAALDERRTAEADTIDSLVAEAQAGGYAGDSAALRAELQDRFQLRRDFDKEFAESGRDPVVLLRTIAAAGGIGTDPMFSGELAWLRQLQDNFGTALTPRTAFGLVRGVRGVFQPKGAAMAGSRRSGLTLSMMTEVLSQDPRFPHIQTVNDLIEELRIAAIENPERDALDRFKKGLGERWWERLGTITPSEDDRPVGITDEDDVSFDPDELETQPPTTDTLDTGEVQSRLLGAEAARQVGQADTTFRAPVQATSGEFALEASLTEEQRAAQAEADAGPSLFGEARPAAKPARESAAERSFRKIQDRVIGPREVGGVYRSGYAGQTYEVLDVKRLPEGDVRLTVKWHDDGRTTTHATAWDQKRDRVISQPSPRGEGTKAGTEAFGFVDPFTAGVVIARRLWRARQAQAQAEQTPLAASSLEDVEARWQASKGIEPPSIRQKAREALEALKKITRHFPEIDPSRSPMDAVALELLLEQERAGRWAQVVAHDRIAEIIDGLAPNDADLLARALALPDILKDLDDGLYEGREELPFGYTSREQVEQDLVRVNAAVEQNPKVKDALTKRGRFVSRLTQELVDAELLPETVLKDSRYYHRQVMAYMSAQDPARVGTTRGREVRQRTRGFQRQRVGGTDFNTRYVEAEFEWVAQALAELKTKATLEALKALADETAALKQQAKELNLERLGEKLLAEYTRSGQRPGEEQSELFQLADAKMLAEDALKPFNQQIAIGIEELLDALLDGNYEVAERFEEAVEELKDGWRDYQAEIADLDKDERKNYPPFDANHPLWWPMLADLVQHKTEAGKWAASIFKAIRGREDFIKETLGRDYLDRKDPEDLVTLVASEGYVTWQPKEGNHFFRVQSVDERVLDRVIEGTRNLTPEDKRGMMVMGGPRETWIVPEWLAETLDQFGIQPQTPGPLGAIDRLWSVAIGTWKQQMLLFPGRIARYNVNNMSGDMDAALAYAPGIFTHLPDAAGFLHRAFYGEALAADTARLERLTELGVIDAGLTALEIPDVNTLPGFRQLAESDPQTFMAWLVSLGPKYYRFARKITQFRENLLRVAAFDYMREKVQAGARPYGASNPARVDALRARAKTQEGKERLAALLARDLIGDYQAVSAFTQFMRSRTLPFFSFQEINFKRYIRLFQNAVREGKTGKERAWQGIRTAGTATARASLKWGIRFALVNAFMVSVVMFNKLFFPDEDDELRRRGREQLHLILGRHEDGSIRTLRIEGAFADFLEWFGVGHYLADIGALFDADITIGEKLTEMVQATPNKIVQLWEPFTKQLFEQIAGRRTFPSAFRPTPIRDRGEHLAGIAAVDRLYARITGKPVPPGNPVARLLFYRTDPGEAAYFDIRAKVVKWLEAQGKVRAGPGDPTDRSNALYYWKRAVQWNDEAAAARWRQRYFQLGGTPKGMAQSVKLSTPLGAVSARDRWRFQQQLRPSDRQILTLAERWYRRAYSAPRTRPVAPATSGVVAQPTTGTQ